MSNTINWFESREFDAPALGSPQPCVHGSGCVFTVKGADGIIIPGCCRYVHPGEEGNGRRYFPARGSQKACVRLTGKAGFYERCRLKMSWQAWCERENIPYTPNKTGVRHEPVTRFPIGKLADTAVALRTEAFSVLDRIKMLIAVSTLSAEDKAELSDTINDEALEMIGNIISKIQRSIGVPLTGEELRINNLTTDLKDTISNIGSVGVPVSLNAEITQSS